jgi:hypothetical protein
VRRESYVGAWLPEPLIAGHEPDPAEQAEMSDSLSMAFLVLLESLSPAERAVFLLHEVFGYGYAEIAEITGMSYDAEGRVLNVFALDIADGMVQVIRSVVNPGKLHHLGPVSDTALRGVPGDSPSRRRRGPGESSPRS